MGNLKPLYYYVLQPFPRRIRQCASGWWVESNGDNEIDAEDAGHLALALLEYALANAASEDTGNPQFNREPHQPLQVQGLLDLRWNNLIVSHNLPQESVREVRKLFGATADKKPGDYRTAKKRVEATTDVYAIKHNCINNRISYPMYSELTACPHCQYPR